MKKKYRTVKVKVCFIARKLKVIRREPEKNQVKYYLERPEAPIEKRYLKALTPPTFGGALDATLYATRKWARDAQDFVHDVYGVNVNFTAISEKVL